MIHHDIIPFYPGRANGYSGSVWAQCECCPNQSVKHFSARRVEGQDQDTLQRLVSELSSMVAAHCVRVGWDNTKRCPECKKNNVTSPGGQIGLWR